jgi:hypothetical protein
MLFIPTSAPTTVEIGLGTFGKICKVEGRKGSVSKRFRLKKYHKVIKNELFNSDSFIEAHSPDDVKDAILECSLAKICSMLGIGP